MNQFEEIITSSDDTNQNRKVNFDTTACLNPMKRLTDPSGEWRCVLLFVDTKGAGLTILNTAYFVTQTLFVLAGFGVGLEVQ